MGRSSLPSGVARRLRAEIQAKILNGETPCHYPDFDCLYLRLPGCRFEEWTQGAMEAGYEWSSVRIGT